MPRSSQRGRKNNNPEGRNQYSGGLRETVRNHPIASAAAAGAAAAASAFLWSKRDRISEKANEMSGRFNEWAGEMRSGNGSALAGKRTSETGSESMAQPSMTASSAKGSTRATCGRSGKAQSGQTMSPSRTASETVTY